jgi:hypothetical protein
MFNPVNPVDLNELRPAGFAGEEWSPHREYQAAEVLLRELKAERIVP